MDTVRSLRVLRVPVEPNHYQSLSVAALGEFGVETTGAGYLDRSVAFGFWTHDIVHIDWLDGFARSTRSLRQRIRTQTLLVVLLLGAVLFRRPVFWTLHNAQPHSGAGRAWRVWKRVLARLATDTVTLSPTATSHARSLRLKGSLTELRFGSFLEVLRPVQREQARGRWIPEDASVLLIHFGQIREQKGVADLLASMRHIEGEDVRLVVAGRVNSAKTSELLAGAAAADHRIIVLNRFLEDDELASLLSAADIAVMPFDGSLTSSSAHVAAEFGLVIVAPDSDLFRPYHSRYLYQPDLGRDGLAACLRQAVEHCRSRQLSIPEFVAPSWHDAVEPLAERYRQARARPAWRRFER